MRNKGDVSRFQILVEIAERQPAVRQLEIAEKIGMTPQAVSEYIRDLVDEGMVAVSGRSNYAVTKTGMAWVMENADCPRIICPAYPARHHQACLGMDCNCCR